MKAEMIRETCDGIRIYSKKEVPEKPCAVCVIIHGMGEHQGRYDLFAERLFSAGIAVYRFDHRGHGRSEGERGYFSSGEEPLLDTEMILDLAAEEYRGLPLFLAGHSMGGLISFAIAARDPSRTIAGIVTAGALTMDHYKIVYGVKPDVDPMQEVSLGTADGVCSLDAVINAYVRDPLNVLLVKAGLCQSLGKILKWLWAHTDDIDVPVFMMHGEKDGAVSPQDTWDFFHLLKTKDKQMKYYGGAFHELFQEFCREEVMADAIAWMKARIPS